MKTLNQFWDDSKNTVPIGSLSYEDWLRKCLKWTFREWLKQKRQEFESKTESELDEYSFMAIFDELIEEVNK